MENLESYVGKVISSVVLGNDDALHFVFSDNSKMKVFDDGQSCCETRYMRTDDDLSIFAGSKLVNVEIRQAANIETDEDTEYSVNCHEIQFLEVMTSIGCFTMATHNEHNGYYDGFCVVIEADE